MTPPDNTEQREPGGTDTTTGEVPPWQRVAKDGSAGTSDGDEGATQWLTSPVSAGASTVPPAPGAGGGGAQPPQQPGGEGSAFGQGAVANRLFGQGEQSATRTAQPQGSDAGKSGSGTQSLSAFRRPGRGPRRANLQVRRVDPWSVLKLSLVLGVALFFIWLVAVGVLYTVLDGMGVWDSINGTYDSLVANDAVDGDVLITAGTVFGAAAIVGAVNIVLISALATVGAFIYNVSAGLSGGLELTLSERE
ncbi:DUF3566 domain-containing protein [Saccharomonospora viridis]|uniref:DUF3566 domain-containing protein n=3 Tax=Saccharomonospora viridis TaxID=1852 RepID=C7MRP0_SACVD|nr:DUF3566 domain-containing protein [Saccharomonospora viridis]ACU95102.1 hypothetical protein Svir_00080 [Saccharomonospora viridis DSM 43017]KHF44730.1 hypothetical protein MINT15_16120 [Saccharomonospora viridis]SFP21775.1 Transmembrane protein of unknown function [Saccharomonospora viridis]